MVIVTFYFLAILKYPDHSTDVLEGSAGKN